MKEQPRRQLKRLIGKYGSELASDPRRTEALLNDLCGQHRREIFVLVNAQKQRVAEELLAAPRWMPGDTLRARLVRRLQEKLALTEDAAQWAVDSWAFALEPAEVGKKRTLTWPSTWRRNASRTDSKRSQKSKRKTASTAEKGQSEKLGVQSDDSQAVASGENVRQRKRHGARSGRAGSFSRGLERPRVALLLLWIAVLGAGTALAWFVAVGGVTQPVNVGPSAQSEWWTAASGIEEPHRYLSRTYPTSRSAWVSEGPLLVRSGPSTENDFLGMLETGAGVIVEEFSVDAKWSRLSQPISGWVSNQFLNFLSETESPVAVHLTVQPGSVGSLSTTVLQGPGPEFATVDSLPDSASIVVVAVTIDNQWIQIAEPLAGWLDARDVRIPDE